MFYFLFHDVDLELGPPLLLSWFMKSCKLGYFHAYYTFFNLAKVLPNFK